MYRTLCGRCGYIHGGWEPCPIRKPQHYRRPLMKQTPKSCSCKQCKRGKHSPYGRFLRNLMNRQLRNAWRKQRREEDPVTSPAPTGNYFD